MIIILLILLKHSNCGTIKSRSIYPVRNNLANIDNLSDYKIEFYLENDLKRGGYIRVIFPSQFQIGWGIVNLSCNVICKINNRQIDFYFNHDLIKNKDYFVEIFKILNPSKLGGTGSFKIFSIKGNQIIDENKIFSVIGFASSVKDLVNANIELDKEGFSTAGALSKYIFRFTVSDKVPENFFIRIYLPENEFEINLFPSCSAYPVNGTLIKGKLICKSNLNYIDINGIQGGLLPNSSYGIIMSLKNPGYAHFTGNFSIFLIKIGTNVLYQQYKNIQGLTITPGRLTNIFMRKIDSEITITKNKAIWFKLNFKINNKLNENSIIKLSFPPTIKIKENKILNISYTYYVSKGLKDKTEDNPLTISYDGNTNFMYIRNYANITNENIEIKFLAVTPNNFGESSPIKIETFTKELSGNEIEFDDIFGKIFVNNIPSNNIMVESALNLSANFGIKHTQYFQFNPKITIPSEGFIKFIFDEQFLLDEVNNNLCLISTTSVSNFVNSKTCIKSKREISVQLTNFNFLKDTQYQVKFENILFLPNIEGIFLVDITSYLNDGITKLESFTSEIIYSPNILNIANLNLIPHIQNNFSLIKVNFETPIDIPHSLPQNNTSEIVSFIDLSFEGRDSTTINNNLGFASKKKGDKIACKMINGFLPLNGINIDCFLFDKIIRIKNYYFIKKNTKIEFLIGEFNTPNGNFNLELRVVQKKDRIFKRLTRKVFPITFTTNSVSNFDRSIYNKETFYNVNNKLVSEVFNLEFKLFLNSNIWESELVLIEFPFYDDGFIRNYNNIVCLINNILLKCIPLESSDRILIYLNEYDTIPPSSETNIVIRNLQWPKLVKINLSNIKIKIISTSYILKTIYTYPNFISPLPSPLLNPSLVVNKRTRNAVDVEYKFSFTLSRDLPDNSQFILEFPSLYDLIRSEPSIKVLTPNFEYLSSNSLIEFFYSSNKININRIKGKKKGESFTIIIEGIKNPNIPGIINNFKGYTAFNDLTIEYIDTIGNLNIEGNTQPFNISLKNIICFPLNADSLVDFTFIFNPNGKLTKGTLIKIIFPNEYKNLPIMPFCSIKGGLNSFEKCETVFNTITLTIDETFNKGDKDLIIEIFNIQNADKGLTGSFKIETEYDKEITSIYNKDESLSKINIHDLPNKIILKKFEIDPLNEGEPSQLSLEFYPQNDINLGYQIDIIFNLVFDEKLGEKINCLIISGLKGNIRFNYLKRKISIAGFDLYKYSINNPISIRCNGINNPNLEDSNNAFISIAIRKENNNILTYYGRNIIKIQTVNAPFWCYFNNLKISNNYSREKATYTINFTTFKSIPKVDSNGFILFNLPSQFNINNEKWRIVSKNTDFGLNLECNVINNVAYINGNSLDYIGNLELKIYGIWNPLEKLRTDNFIIKTYDNYNKRIIERSYENLDPFYLNFDFYGPLIIINDNKPIEVIKGTVSQNIPIYIQNKAAINLKLTAVVNQFRIIPEEIDIFIGQLNTYFSISASEDSNEGTYNFNWNLYGEKLPKIYSPILPSTVIIKSKKELKINISQIGSIPFGGKSLPVIIDLEYAPDIGFYILINLKKDYKGISLNTKRLNFQSGIKKLSFTLEFTNIQEASKESLLQGEIDFQILGVNKGLYQLPFNSMNFYIGQPDTIKPSLTKFDFLNINKTIANFSIEVSESCSFYYMVALKGTIDPKFSELINFGPTKYSTTESQYNVIYFYKDNLKKNLNIKNLFPQSEYTIYIILQDLGNQQSNLIKYDLKTQDRFRTADVSIKINQSFLNYSDKINILNSISLLLSLPRNKLIEKKYSINTNSNNPRLLQSLNENVLNSENINLSEVSILFNFNILPSPENDIYPSPKILGNLLNQKIQLLSARIKNLDKNYIITSTDFPFYTPNYVLAPTLVNFDFDYVQIKVQFDNFGFFYCIAIESSLDVKEPSPQQISSGLNTNNIPVPSASLEIYKKYSNFILTIKNLKPETNYNIYAIGANSHPGYPDTMDPKFIEKINVKTKIAPFIEFLDLNFIFISKLWTIFLIILLIK